MALCSIFQAVSLAGNRVFLEKGIFSPFYYAHRRQLFLRHTKLSRLKQKLWGCPTSYCPLALSTPVRCCDGYIDTVSCKHDASLKHRPHTVDFLAPTVKGKQKPVK